MLPSHYEPFGIVALEAAAAGIPLVSSSAGGLGGAVIDGETRLSFPPRDVAALAAQQRSMAARARLTSDFSWQTVVERTGQVYLAAKRGELSPQPHRIIVERPLPDYG
ncbi:hypothetical protein MBRU_16295 [Mycolicibacterium brumae DSM 44177]|nr:hypothetical protein MBRU_16295 [Mycolicibacterium brumae DSM 44177]